MALQIDSISTRPRTQAQSTNSYAKASTMTDTLRRAIEQGTFDGLNLDEELSALPEPKSTTHVSEDQKLYRPRSTRRNGFQAFPPNVPQRSPSRLCITDKPLPIPDVRQANGENHTLPSRNHVEPLRTYSLSNRSKPDEFGRVAGPEEENSIPSPITTRHVDDRSYFESDSISISKQSGMSSASSRLPDFFGPGIFQVVLHNPTTAHQLLKFSQSRFCSENVEFLGKVGQYHKLLNDLTSTMTDIHKDFISPDAPNQINLPDGAMKTVHVEMKNMVNSTLPAMETMFLKVQEKIEHLVFTDIYPRFVRYQMTMSATRALASDRSRYQGLGDCFCLTNPSKADNPIVSASDGFVKVTGYTRPEIIPRNCRFLQGQQTDKIPVRRLKNSIDQRKESVELILNYKKNGEPFWNLLYVAPLFNVDGRVAFFIGGQINCSTTIHNNGDIMKILSTSSDLEEDNATTPTSNGFHRNSSMTFQKKILKAFGSRREDSRMPPGPREAGMEHDLLSRIEGRDLRTQMNEFYTAYSKYIVVKYDTYTIEFFSTGVTEMLNPTNILNSGGVIGSDIFKFLKHNMVSNNTDYKSKVRAALKGGYPISIDIHLQTRRSAVFRGDEKFATHWTPLKDENAAVNYIVVTLSPVLQHP